MTAIARREKLMSVDELSDYLGIPVATLYQWRHKGTGPPAFRVGRHLRYDPGDVSAWLDGQNEVRHGLR